MSAALTKLTKFSLLGLTALAAGLACSSSIPDDDSGGAGKASGTAGTTAGASGSGTATAGSGGSPGTAGTGTSGSTATAGHAGTGGNLSTAGSGGVPSTAGSGGVSTAGHAGTGGSGGTSGSTSGGSSGSGTGGGTSGTFDPCPATGDCKVLPLGDSITFGTPTNKGGYRVKLFIDAMTDGKKMTIVGGASGGAAANGPAMVTVGSMMVAFPGGNEGYPGIKIGDLDNQHVSNGKSFANMPNIVLLHIGTNDMYGGNPGGAPDALKKIIDDITMQVPNALLAVSSIIPLSSGNAAVMTYNATIPGIVQMKAAAGKHVIYVDQYKDFPTNELTDGVHPTDDKGYPRMGDAWYAAIKSYLH